MQQELTDAPSSMLDPSGQTLNMLDTLGSIGLTGQESRIAFDRMEDNGIVDVSCEWEPLHDSTDEEVCAEEWFRAIH